LVWLANSDPDLTGLTIEPRGGTMELISLIAFAVMVAAWIVAPERASA
jgi:hypothetical protein